METVITFLKQHDDFLLLTHRRPDGDALGSAAALCAGLRALGKTAHVWKNPEITARYLPYLQPYLAPDEIRVGTVVALDTAAVELLPESWSGVTDLRIDHHPGRAAFALNEYTDPSAAACGEVIYTVLNALGVTLTADIAALLYIAISTDTGCFRYSNTTAATHRITAALIDAGADANTLNTVFFTKTRGRMAAVTAVQSGLRFEAGGAAVIASLSLAEKNAANAAEDDLENVAGLVQGIEGVSVGFMLREEADGWRVSCRSAGEYEANKICQKLSDGGGHKYAAGARIKGSHSETEARAIALSALFETYPSLREKLC